MGWRDNYREGRATRQRAVQRWKERIEASADENGMVDTPSLWEAADAYDEETKDVPWYAR